MIAVAMAAVLLTAWTFLAPAWAQFSGAPTKQKVSISQTTTDNDVDAIQSGTWTVQPGNTQNTVPWLAKLHDGTNALAAYLDLDTGAGTEFRQGVGLRISGAGGSIEAKGQQVMASSIPVALASDQSALSVTLAANQSVNVAQVNGVTTTTGNGISGTGVQRVSIASDSTGQVALAAGVATIGSLVANQSVNTAQINGVAPTMGNGISGTGVQRVTLASDSTGQVALAAGAATIGSLAANQSVNTSQINGVAPSMSNGVDGTGVQRVTLASDSTGQVVLAAGAAIIGSLAANQSVNMAQAAGAALLVGNGITGTGSPRVTIASDNTPFTVNAAQSGTWNVGTLTTITNAVTTQDQAQAGAGGAWDRANSGAYEASRVIKASAGRLRVLMGYNSKTSAQFIQVFNSTTVPADATAPIYTFTVPASSNFSLDLGETGDYFSTGIAVSNSSTGATKTIGSADVFFTAIYK